MKMPPSDQRIRRVYTLQICILLALSLGGPAWSYTLHITDGGQVVHWECDEVTVVLDESLGSLGDHALVSSRLRDAIATWESSGYFPAHFSTIDGSGTQIGYVPNQANVNAVMAFDDSWPFPSDYTAVTVSTYEASTGNLLDVDIVFDAKNPWSFDDFPDTLDLDFLDAATHELGHLLGLEHSDVAEATMFAESPLGSIERRSLHQDDLDALAATYGPPELLGRAQEAGCSVSATPSGDLHFGFFLLALSVVARIWSRR